MKIRFSKGNIVKLLFFILFNISTVFNVFGDDISILKSRFYDYYIENTSSSITYLSTMNADGSWSDINYDDTSRTGWEPIIHLNRLAKFCSAYNNEANDFYHSDFLLNKIELGLNYWYSRNSVSLNWWYNEIGTQLQLEPILILMSSYLNSSLIIKGCEYFEHNSSSSYINATGENLVWYSSQLVHKGVLLNDIDYINTGISKLASTLKITSYDKEGGICPDFSFHQHYFLYNNGYGLGFIEDMAFWAYMTRNLSFNFNSENIYVLSNLILEGTQWMTYYGDLDYVTVGREIVRKNKLNSISAIVNSLQYMSNVDTLKRGQFLAYLNNLNGGVNAKIGSKYFWSSDYYSHRRKDYAVSLNMSSVRTVGTESGNGENANGYFLASGSMFIESTEGSYYNIPPVWNWNMLPGVTCAQHVNPPSIQYPFYGSTDFVGGVTDSLYGVASMDYNIDNTLGKKSWFFFENEIVAVCSGINSSNTEKIITTLNQQLVNGETYYFDSENHTISDGEMVLKNIKWLFHDKIAYVLPEQTDIHVSLKSQSGSWSDINEVYTYSSISENVFTAWIDHGIQPKSSSYYYIIVPGIERDEVNDFINKSPIELLSNTSSIQAVRNDSLRITGITFYSADYLNLNDSFISSIVVDSPCILLLDENNNYLSASNPLQTALDLKVKLNYTDGSSDSIVYNFPGGDYGGQSIKQILPMKSANFGVVDRCEDVNIDIVGEVTENYSSDNNGSISLTVSGGVEPYSYLWNDGLTVKDRTNLSSGEYSVVVTDLYNCSGIASYNIIDEEDPCISFVVNGDKVDTEYDKSVGLITISVKGGVEPYTFLWNDGVQSQNRDKLSIGNYTIEVNDDNKCNKHLSFSIGEKDIPFEIIKVYPNPTSGLIALEYSSPLATNIEIIAENVYNNSHTMFYGKSDIGKNKILIDISLDENGNSNANGLYNIQIRQGESVDVVDVIKTK